MKSSLVIFLILTTVPTMAQDSIGIFSQSRSVASVDNKEFAIFDPQDQSYLLRSHGLDKEDKSNFIYNDLNGDFIITANIDPSVMAPGIQAGLLIENSTQENNGQISATVEGSGQTFFRWNQIKRGTGTEKEQVLAPKFRYDILQLERQGKEIIMKAAHFGEPLQKIGSVKLQRLDETVRVGLFINSHNPDITQEAKFYNVRIDKPVPNEYDPEQDGWLGCRMEIIDVENGKRMVIFEKDDRFEAPNWMPNGDHLLFNMEGSLFTIPIEGGEPEKLNTGFADELNNDHGISFDGQMIAISHHVKDKGSMVFTVPIQGGVPQPVTDEGPSYWHGWAPNNEGVVYVAMRKGKPGYDIYKKPIHGGDEIALTNTREGEHVDGSEYSPDGEYIYYNGSASGTMQIWRMKPDGSGKEQLTFDERNDWFPHISPDGKWIAYISFPTTIPVNSHPSFKRVTLNLMPTSGGAPKVIAYLYGGQGSINVPSWSPDSKYLAFVSNSGK
ncbi:TolB family protein [Salinimicrobium xinjiangense]|uniref:TolB family protein n=1 Tax=Salinimicrobium xinjiangense TaxID=438596 RepID=UPI000424FF7E|nr:TolB family protein [Salinimicrobium xinjiangense]